MGTARRLRKFCLFTALSWNIANVRSFRLESGQMTLLLSAACQTTAKRGLFTWLVLANVHMLLQPRLLGVPFYPLHGGALTPALEAFRGILCWLGQPLSQPLPGAVRGWGLAGSGPLCL